MIFFTVQAMQLTLTRDGWLRAVATSPLASGITDFQLNVDVNGDALTEYSEAFAFVIN